MPIEGSFTQARKAREGICNPGAKTQSVSHLGRRRQGPRLSQLLLAREAGLEKAWRPKHAPWGLWEMPMLLLSFALRAIASVFERLCHLQSRGQASK